MHDIACGLMALPAVDRPALGILPLGTANDFATACRIPSDATDALRLPVCRSRLMCGW